jgi:hypothetical protein
MVKHKLLEWEGICVPILAALTDFLTEQNDDVQYMLNGLLHDREWAIYVSYLKLNHDFPSSSIMCPATCSPLLSDNN